MNLDNLAEEIAKSKYNVGNIYWQSLKFLEANLGGIEIQNATSPMATLLAHSCVTSVINNEEVAKLERMEAPEYAANFDELSRFIPYQQLPLIYAKPAEVPVTLYLGLKDLQDYGVKSGNVKTVVVPKGTVINYGGQVAYGFHHDLKITLTDDSVIDAVYLDNNNPLVELLNPVVKTTKVNSRNEDNTIGATLVAFELTMYQFAKSATLYPVTQGGGFSQTLSCPDQYYHARVYSKISGDWVECRTAFGDFSYDPNDTVPTAVVRHLGDKITIDIPYIYLTRKLVTSEVKVELYTTKGAISVDYLSSTTEDFKVTFNNSDPAIDSLVAPLKSFTIAAAHSSAQLTGGRDIPTFESMRTEVSNNSINAETITEEQLKSSLNVKGYRLIHQSNYLTEDVYLASKSLGTMASDGANVMVLGGNIPFIAQELRGMYGVLNNGDNRTVTPDAIFRYVNGQMSILDQVQGEALVKMDDQSLMLEVNSTRYLSPVFYHVFELSNEINELHTYHLENPKITKRDFVGVNGNAEGTISVDGVSIVKTKGGYQLVVKALATSFYQEMPSAAWVAQIVAKGHSGLKVALNHTGVVRDDDGNFTFVFDLVSPHDLRSSMGIKFSNLTAEYGDTTFLNLLSDLQLSFILIDRLPQNPDDIWKNLVDASKLPDNYQVVSLENVSVEFGSRLDSLHRPIRTIAGQPEFLLHEADVLAYWPKDVPVTKDDGFIDYRPNPDYDDQQPIGEGNRPYTYDLLHAKGDPVMEGGVHKIKYHKGTPVIDEVTHEPIVKGRKPISIETSMVVGDYRLKIAGTQQDVLADAIIENIENDIRPLRPKMIQLSDLYYSVSRSIGETTVRLNADTSRVISKDLSFEFEVVVDSVTYADGEIRSLITKQIRDTTAANINGSTRYVGSDLIAAIKDVLGSTVLGFKLVNVNGYTDINTFALTSEFDSMGVAPKLYINAAGQLAIGDGIEVNFILDQ